MKTSLNVNINIPSPAVLTPVGCIYQNLEQCKQLGPEAEHTRKEWWPSEEPQVYWELWKILGLGSGENMEELEQALLQSWRENTTLCGSSVEDTGGLLQSGQRPCQPWSIRSEDQRSLTVRTSSQRKTSAPSQRSQKTTEEEGGRVAVKTGSDFKLENTQDFHKRLHSYLILTLWTRSVRYPDIH